MFIPVDPWFQPSAALAQVGIVPKLSATMSEKPAPEKFFLVQKFAKIKLGSIHVVGYSVAGEETVIQIPELNVCFDIGRAPFFSLTSDIVCITHSHMDHIAGLGYYFSQRAFQGMKPGTAMIPREIERSVDNLLRCWRDLERQGTPYELIPMSTGQMYEVRRDFGIRAVQTHHGGTSLAYVIVSIREKLKPEYMGKTGPELAKMKADGVEIQYRLEVPLVAFLGDTTAGPVFDHPDIQNAQVLITECTFFDADHKTKAKAGKHLHVDALLEQLPKLKNEYIILTHVSRRTGIRRARGILRKKLGKDQMQRILFLMDFEGSKDAGDIEETVPVPPNGEK